MAKKKYTLLGSNVDDTSENQTPLWGSIDTLIFDSPNLHPASPPGAPTVPAPAESTVAFISGVTSNAALPATAESTVPSISGATSNAALPATAESTVVSISGVTSNATVPATAESTVAFISWRDFKCYR